MRAALIAALACAACAADQSSSTDGGTNLNSNDAGVTITITPSAVTVPPGTQQSFICSVSGAANNACAFSVKESGAGTISSAGIYTAPSTGGAYHVVATAAADSTLTATATVTVPNPTVAACNALAPVGTWENITPPDVQAVLNTAKQGVFAFAVDPVNAGTVYLGTIQLGLWKTTDCGAKFTKISGRGATALNGGMNWTMVIDPQDTQVIYTNAGYGAGSNGLFRSANGGADWDAIWPPSDPSLSAAFANNFTNTVDMDPQDHRHLLLTFHEPCLNRTAKNCIAETKDAGVTWTLLDGDKRWTSDGEGVRALFLDDGKTWLWDSQADGAWRSTNSGASWTQIITQGANHLQATQMYRAQDGTFLLGGMGDLWRSPVGTSNGTWVKDDKLMGPLPGGLVSDGTTIYASNCYYVGFCGAGTKDFYFTAPESDSGNWKPMASPSIGVMNSGGVLGYDRSHHILYSSNLQGGFWRVVTK